MLTMALDKSFTYSVKSFYKFLITKTIFGIKPRVKILWEEIAQLAWTVFIICGDNRHILTLFHSSWVTNDFYEWKKSRAMILCQLPRRLKHLSQLSNSTDKTLLQCSISNVTPCSPLEYARSYPKPACLMVGQELKTKSWRNKCDRKHDSKNNTSNAQTWEHKQWKITPILNEKSLCTFGCATVSILYCLPKSYSSLQNSIFLKYWIVNASLRPCLH